MNSTKPNWHIFIVAHNNIFKKMYVNDPQFDKNHYSYLNVGSNPILSNTFLCDTINQYDLPNSVCLGKWWAESEGIYNIWRSGLYKNYDFIGFTHYDKENRLYKKRFIPSHNTNITERIDKYLQNKSGAHISFEDHYTKKDYGQHILADETKPEILTGDGLNCYDYIINLYNLYFQTHYTLTDFFQKKTINLCSCFLMDIKHFEEMMSYFHWIVESHELEKFDTLHRHRLQGGLAERIFGVYLLFAYNKHLDLTTIHHYNDGLK